MAVGGKTAAVGIVALIVGITIGFFATGGNTIADTPAALPPGEMGMGTQDTYTLGHIAPLTGDLSQYGQDGIAAARLAEADFNEYLEKVGATWRLALAHEDSQTNPVLALEKITALKARGIDTSIIYSSAAVNSVKGYVDANGMVVISATSTAPQLAVSGDGVFRLVPDDTRQGPALAELVSGSGVEIMVPIWRGDTWGDGLHRTAVDAFVAMGGTADEGIRYNPESPALSVSASVLAERVGALVDEHGADRVGVLTIGFAETLELMQEASVHDILDDVLWFCTDGITNNSALIDDPIGLAFVESTRLRGTQPAAAETPQRTDVEARLVDELGRVPNTYSFGVYDAVWLFGKSVLESGSTDAEAIRAALPAVAGAHSGAIGHTALNDAGDLDSGDFAIWGVIDGEWEVVGTYMSQAGTIAPA